LGQTVVARTKNKATEPNEIGTEVRQGCLFSPLLFNIIMMKEVLDGLEEGIKAGGEFVKTVRYAEDQAMIASKR